MKNHGEGAKKHRIAVFFDVVCERCRPGQGPCERSKLLRASRRGTVFLWRSSDTPEGCISRSRHNDERESLSPCAVWPTPPFFPLRIRPCSHPRTPPWARGKFSAFSLKALHVKKRKTSSKSRSFRKQLRRRVRDGELRKWRGPIRRGRHGAASHRRPMFPSTWGMVCCFVDWSSMVIQAI